jgi:HTH-type transcriptional regulator, cell division transcriptional repressor
MNRKNIVGIRVKEARLNKYPKLTQDQLASRLQVEGVHIDRTAVAKIESGSRPVTDIEILALAAVLSVTAAWLLEY